MQDSLLKKIKDDIEKTGFVEELRVGELLHAKNWSVSHSESYEDLDFEKSREIDIVSTKSYSDKETELYTEFHLIIEVKKATKYPWVIFTTPHVYRGWGWRQLHSGWNYTTKSASIFHGEVLETGNPFATKKRFGKAFYEAFKTQNSDENSKIFDAILSVCKASYHKKSNSGETAHKKEFKKDEAVELHFFIPLIVLEGLLFEAYLEHNKITVVQENWIPVEYSISSKKFKHSKRTFFPSIVTTAGINDYLSMVDNWVEKTNENLRVQLKKRKYNN